MNLLNNLNKLHTTELWLQRIKKNLSLETNDIVSWCKNKISLPQAKISKKWKNYYVQIENYFFTINFYTYTIITAHKIKTTVI